MKTKRKRYPTRNGVPMAQAERALFDDLERAFHGILKMEQIAYPDSLPHNLATIAIWEIQNAENG